MLMVFAAGRSCSELIIGFQFRIGLSGGIQANRLHDSQDASSTSAVCIRLPHTYVLLTLFPLLDTSPLF
jgi:hypothetical protein